MDIADSTSEIAGVEFWSPEYPSYAQLNYRLADILGVSPLDEYHRPRDFGVLTEDNEFDDPRFGIPNLGVLWIATISVAIGTRVTCQTNYQIIDYNVTRENYFTASHVCILHPGRSEIDLYTPCVRPEVEWVIEGMGYRERLISWMPNERMDCQPIPVDWEEYGHSP